MDTAYRFLGVVSKLFMDILTGIDGKTFCIARVCFFISLIVYYVMAFLSGIHHHPWSAMDFAGGVSTMAVGFGIQMKLKSNTEPQA